MHEDFTASEQTKTNYYYNKLLGKGLWKLSAWICLNTQKIIGQEMKRRDREKEWEKIGGDINGCKTNNYHVHRL